MAKNFDFTDKIDFSMGGIRVQCSVRPVSVSDIETLRVWKNANREFFFHGEVITPEQQVAWFGRFSQDPGQQLFVCERDSQLLACVGFRKTAGERVELFNLICGDSALLGAGLVRNFYLCAERNLRRLGISSIELYVLKSNTRAIKWYLRQGFCQVGEDSRSLHLVRDLPAPLGENKR